MSLDPKTYHGTHYAEAAFDAELDKRVADYIEEEGDDYDESDYHSLKREIMRKLYAEWNPDTDMDDFIQFEMANSMKYHGYATSGFTTESNDNPLLEPVHGISLKDYAAIAANLGAFDNEKLYKAFGIDQAIFDELNTLWPKRMQEDTSFTLATLYGQYFMEIGDHPVILQLREGSGADGDSNPHLEKLKTDRYYYEELCGARTAAYEYGIDGAKWIEDNFGINLVDFQTVAMQWLTEQNKNFNSKDILHYQAYQNTKSAEYKARFAAEQGGNIADDVAF